MSRYFTKPQRTRSWIGDDLGHEDAPLLAGLCVPDHEATDTGLLDPNGDTIWKEPRPMGFIWGDFA